MSAANETPEEDMVVSEFGFVGVHEKPRPPV